MDRFSLFKKPPNLEKRAPIQSQSIWKCKICKEKQASYTCPRCNLPYCSLECYKSQSHGECSESFYKDCVMEDLKSSRASDTTKKNMMKILEKMQRENADEADIFDEASAHEGKQEAQSLDERLRGVNLDDDQDDIWERLTEEERQEFEEFIRNENLSEIIEPWEPWWMKELIHPKIRELDSSKEEDELLTDRPDIPLRIDAPDLSQLFQRHPPSPTVKFAVINTLYAYALIGRVYNGDHLAMCESSAENLLEISCGLRGDHVLQSAEEAIIKALSDADQSSVKSLMDSRDFRALCMLDVVKILEESFFIEAALSDVHAVLKRAWKKGGKQKKFADGYKKVEYFLAYVESFQSEFARAISGLRFHHVTYIQETLEHNKVGEILQQKKALQKEKPRLIQEL